MFALLVCSILNCWMFTTLSFTQRDFKKTYVFYCFMVQYFNRCCAVIIETLFGICLSFNDLGCSACFLVVFLLRPILQTPGSRLYSSLWLERVIVFFVKVGLMVLVLCQFIQSFYYNACFISFFALSFWFMVFI